MVCPHVKAWAGAITYRIDVTNQWDNEGGKGVVGMAARGVTKGTEMNVIYAEQSEMPFDPITGETADIVISTETTTNRTNPARFNEQTLKASMREMERWLEKTTGVQHQGANIARAIQQLPKEVLDACFAHIEGYLGIVTPTQYEWYRQLSYQEKVADLIHIMRDRFYVYMPMDNPRDILEVFQTLIDQGYLSPPNKLKMWNPYKNQYEETITPMRIGELYYICLEKVGDSAAAVSTAATQPNGIIVPLTSRMKHVSQVRRQATRFPGESENRLLVAGGPSGLAAEIHDRSANPDTVDIVLHSIYDAENPVDIESVVDRDIHPLGNNRPLQILRHFLSAEGTAMSYEQFDTSKQRLANSEPVSAVLGSMWQPSPEDLAEDADSEDEDEDENESEADEYGDETEGNSEVDEDDRNSDD